MNTHKASAAAPQDFIEPMSRSRRGGETHTEFRGLSRPSRNLASLTPDRDATENKRIQEGPEYPIHGLSTCQSFRHTCLPLYRSTTTTPQSTVTASYDGLVGLTSPELVVLASPRSIRCLYCYKDFRCLTKSSRSRVSVRFLCVGASSPNTMK